MIQSLLLIHSKSRFNTSNNIICTYSTVLSSKNMPLVIKVDYTVRIDFLILMHGYNGHMIICTLTGIRLYLLMKRHLHLLHELAGQAGHYFLADNVTLHRAAQIKATIADPLNILRITTYSPDCNFIEYLWQIMNHTNMPRQVNNGEANKEAHIVV